MKFLTEIKPFQSNWTKVSNSWDWKLQAKIKLLGYLGSLKLHIQWANCSKGYENNTVKLASESKLSETHKEKKKKLRIQQLKEYGLREKLKSTWKRFLTWISLRMKMYYYRMRKFEVVCWVRLIWITARVFRQRFSTCFRAELNESFRRTLVTAICTRIFPGNDIGKMSKYIAKLHEETSQDFLARCYQFLQKAELMEVYAQNSLIESTCKLNRGPLIL